MIASSQPFAAPAVTGTHAAAAPITALLQCSNLGGMEQVAYTLFERLRSRGTTIRVVTPRPWGKGRSRLQKVDPLAEAFDYRGKFGWRTFPNFRQQVKAVEQSSQRVWVIGTCVSCLAAARLSGRTTLLSHHYHHFENSASRLRWTAFYLAFGPGLDAITYPTEFTRNEALTIAPWLKAKTHVVRNGFDVHYTTEERRLESRQAARAALRMPQDAFIVGNAGWLIRRKRFDVFLRTAQIVSRKLPHARFYICGGGPEEQSLRQLAAELGIADKVHFQGWVENMSVYYQAWDALLFNTDFDALGNSPLEAASHGCLSVASCIYGGLSEFIDHGQTGLLWNHHDLEKMAGGLINLAGKTGLSQSIRTRAVAKLKQEFSNEAAVRFYEHYFCGNR